jgi:hypothetical protein
MAKDLTTEMCLDKIWYLSPLAHFVILKNPMFFSVDRLGVQSEFYEIMLTSASGESPENVVDNARANFMGFTFSWPRGVSRKLFNPTPQETLLQSGTQRLWRLMR